MPGFSGVPTWRNHVAPKRAMSATWARVSTFWTRVGRPPTPRSRMEVSPTKEGTAPLRPLSALTTADSWPARKASGASAISMAIGSRRRARRSASAASTTGMLAAGT